MKKLLFSLLFLNLLIITITVIPKTYAFWTQPLPSDLATNAEIKIGKWKKLLILEELGNLEKPKEGLEFVYQNQFYVVLWDFDQVIPNQINWWGWKNPLSGINLLTENWIDSNYYDQKSLPVNKDGNFYLATETGASNHLPGTDKSWFKISPYYLSTNVYPKGFIISHGINEFGKTRYWIANQYNQGINPGNYAWAWTEILTWNGRSSKGEIVYNIDSDGSIRFWETLKNTKIEPNENSSKEGYFLEIKNGWISPLDNEIIVNFWLEHNSYQKGEIITYGIDNCLRYRYFKSLKKSVGETPFSIINGQEVLNRKYWQEIR